MIKFGQIMCPNVLGVLSHSLARAASPITFPHLGVADLPKLKSIFFTFLHLYISHFYIFTYLHFHMFTFYILITFPHFRGE